MLHPELTASATAAEAAEVRALDASAHASCNRTCEIGMSRATGRGYRHVLELLEEVTRPHRVTSGAGPPTAQPSASRPCGVRHPAASGPFGTMPDGFTSLCTM